MNEGHVAERIESFVRNSFEVAPGDPHFGRDVNLFEGGYVDSIGLTELLAFLQAEFDVDVPDEQLASDQFTTIDGMAGIVASLAGT